MSRRCIGFKNNRLVSGHTSPGHYDLYPHRKCYYFLFYTTLQYWFTEHDKKSLADKFTIVLTVMR